jgi:hypothetical protein
VAIDTSGKCWVGSEAADIADFLKAYKAEGYEVDAIRLCKCRCGSTTFELAADRDEGCAQRACAVCRTKHLVCDSADHWQDAQPQSWTCSECQWNTCNLAVGFSLYEPEEGQRPDVRWISIGQRCTNCGTLASFVIGRSGPVPHLSFSIMLETALPSDAVRVIRRSSLNTVQRISVGMLSGLAHAELSDVGIIDGQHDFASGTLNQPNQSQL